MSVNPPDGSIVAVVEEWCKVNYDHAIPFIQQVRGLPDGPARIRAYVHERLWHWASERAAHLYSLIGNMHQAISLHVRKQRKCKVESADDLTQEVLERALARVGKLTFLDDEQVLAYVKGFVHNVRRETWKGVRSLSLGSREGLVCMRRGTDNLDERLSELSFEHKESASLNAETFLINKEDELDRRRYLSETWAELSDGERATLSEFLNRGDIIEAGAKPKPMSPKVRVALHRVKVRMRAKIALRHQE